MSSRDVSASAWSAPAWPGSTTWLILVVVIATWISTAGTPFAEDDWLYLESVRSGRPAASFFSGEGVMDHHYRPLSDAVVFYAFRHPIVYHAVGMLAVFVAALALVALALALGLPPPAAAAAGVLLASRDLFFPAMAWGSGFSDLGGAAFALTAVATSLRWVRGGAMWRAGLSVLLAVAAVLTKEIAIVVVPLAAVTVLSAQGPVPRRTRLVFLAVLALAVAAIAFRQWQLASFDESYGASLYQLRWGAHTVARLPVYAVWSVAAVRELDTALPALVAIAIAIAVGWGLGFGRGADGASHRRWIVLGLAWFVIALAPALLAPHRFHTNYLAIAAAGPCWILGAMLTVGSRPAARVLLAVLVVGGPILVGLKSTGRLASGGWVNLDRAERLLDAVESVTPIVAGVPHGGRVLVLGGLEVDVRVLGDPRGQGFGPQQVLASAIRVETGRADLDVLSLPRAVDLTAAATSATRDLVTSAPDRTRVIDLGPPVRDVTDRFGTLP